MAKILMSWMAAVHDFIPSSGKVNQNGPNCSIHQHLYDGYDCHVLLTTASKASDDTKYQTLVNHLRTTYGHRIEEVAMDISNRDVINLSAISKVVNGLLLTKYRDDEIDIFISPGTPTMQVAWYMARISLGLDIRLFQTVKHDQVRVGMPEKIWVTPDQIGYISSLLVKEAVSTESGDTSDRIIAGQLKPIYERAAKIALADVSVLITGETGTGKELLARHIHDSSHRKGESFVAINCAAFGNELLESRLFGHKKGAFTGALSDATGLFHEANGGTIFLDEIGDISPYMQQTLLRVLSKREIMRVGSNKTEKVNVRVLAATNKDIYRMSVKEEYRADLYYRLSTCEIHLPSLEECGLKYKEEVFDYLWHRARHDFKRNTEPKLPAALRKQLLAHTYPGNIREMENLVYGIWAEAEQKVTQAHLPKRLLNPAIENSPKLEDVVRNHVRKVYESTGNNISRTANILDVQPNTVRNKLKIKTGGGYK